MTRRFLNEIQEFLSLAKGVSPVVDPVRYALEVIVEMFLSEHGAWEYFRALAGLNASRVCAFEMSDRSGLCVL